MLRTIRFITLLVAIAAQPVTAETISIKHFETVEKGVTSQWSGVDSSQII